MGGCEKCWKRFTGACRVTFGCGNTEGNEDDPMFHRNHEMEDEDNSLFSSSSSSSGNGGAPSFTEVHLLRRDINEKQNFPDNSIRTAKYTRLSALPLSLLYQFHKISNVYFLLVMIISLIPGASPINPFSSVVPLVIVLGAGILKDLWEDLKRQRADTKANAALVHVLRGDRFEAIRSRDVYPGDVMLLRLGEEVKADCVVLNTSLPDGLTYIETANLDGETNAKTRRAKIQTVECLGTVESIIEVSLDGTTVANNSVTQSGGGGGTCCCGDGATTTREARLVILNREDDENVDNDGGEYPTSEGGNGHCRELEESEDSVFLLNECGGGAGGECSGGRHAIRKAGALGTVESSSLRNFAEPLLPARTRGKKRKATGGNVLQLEHRRSHTVDTYLYRCSSGHGKLNHQRVSSVQQPQRYHARMLSSSGGPPSAQLRNGTHYMTFDERLEQEGALTPPPEVLAMSRRYDAVVHSRTQSQLTQGMFGAEANGRAGAGAGGGLGYTLVSQPECSTSDDSPRGHDDVSVMEPAIAAPGTSDGVVILAGLPNPDLYSWYGLIHFHGASIPFGCEQFLPRGCLVRNTDWVLAAVVYTGGDTKMLLNLSHKMTKTTAMAQRLNRLNVVLFVINQVMMFVLCGLALYFKKMQMRHVSDNKTGFTAWYMHWTLTRFSDAKLFWWRYLTNFILLSYLIPMSLYVTLEFNKAMQMLMIGADKRMAVYDEFSGTLKKARPKTSELNTQLAQVGYIFTDKTGTLTENLMTFVAGYISGHLHDEREEPGGLGCLFLQNAINNGRHKTLFDRASSINAGAHSLSGGGGGAFSDNFLSASVHFRQAADDGATTAPNTLPLIKSGVSHSDIPLQNSLVNVQDLAAMQATSTRGRVAPSTGGSKNAARGRKGERGEVEKTWTFGEASITEKEVEKDAVFQYLRALSLCHSVVCFDAVVPVDTTGGEEAQKEDDEDPKEAKRRRKRERKKEKKKEEHHHHYEHRHHYHQREEESSEWKDDIVFSSSGTANHKREEKKKKKEENQRTTAMLQESAQYPVEGGHERPTHHQYTFSGSATTSVPILTHSHTVSASSALVSPLVPAGVSPGGNHFFIPNAVPSAPRTTGLHQGTLSWDSAAADALPHDNNGDDCGNSDEPLVQLQIVSCKNNVSNKEKHQKNDKQRSSKVTAYTPHRAINSIGGAVDTGGGGAAADLHGRSQHGSIPSYPADLHGRTGSAGWYYNRYNLNAIHQQRTSQYASMQGLSQHQQQASLSAMLNSFIERDKMYEGQSLDETALVSAARENGFELYQRTAKQMYVKVMGSVMCYDIIAELEFTPERKLMSILLQRNPDGDSTEHAQSAVVHKSSYYRDATRFEECERQKAQQQQQGDEGKSNGQGRERGSHSAARSDPVTAASDIERDPLSLSDSSSGSLPARVVGAPTAAATPRLGHEPYGGEPSCAWSGPAREESPMPLTHTRRAASPQLLGTARGNSSGGADATTTTKHTRREHTPPEREPAHEGQKDDLQQQQRYSTAHKANTHPYLLLTKGADSSMLEIVNTSNPKNAEMKTAMLDHMTKMAKNGLRTLILGQRYVPEEEVRAWLPINNAAQCSLHERSERVHEAYALLEKNIDLIGATAVEDKLQDGVPETLDFLSKALIVVWMLTGDKRETAVTIAHTSGLVSSEYGEDCVCHLDITNIIGEEAALVDAQVRQKNQQQQQQSQKPAAPGPTPNGFMGSSATATTTTTMTNSTVDVTATTAVSAATATAIKGEASEQQRLQQFRKLKEDCIDNQLAAAEALCDRRHGEHGANTVVLVVDGKTLDFIFSDHSRCHRFFTLGTRCRSAVCCRMTPLQKAEIVRMFQRNVKAVALAIGDGANDVSMIQESKIGVGIMGLEGSQAELASDYAIPKFRFLKRLLMVHGRFSFFREAHCIVYSIYKNVIITVGLILYSFYSGFSGQTLMDSWLLAIFSIFFCSLQPLMIGILDKDVDDELAESLPLLYPPLARENMYFSVPYIAKCLLDGAVEGALFFFFIIYTAARHEDLYSYKSGGVEDYGETYFTMLVLVCDLRVGIMVCYYMILFALGVLAEIIVIPVIELIYSEMHNLAGSNWCLYVAHALYDSGKFWMFLLFAVGVMLCYSVATNLYIQMFSPWINAGLAMNAAHASPYRPVYFEEKRRLEEEYKMLLMKQAIAEEEEAEAAAAANETSCRGGGGGPPPITSAK